MLAKEKTLNKERVAVALLLSIIAPFIAWAVPIGYCPGLDKLIDAADAVVVLRIDRHLSDFNSRTFYSTHECYIYQTIKGDIPENASISLQLMNTEGSFATPYAHGSTHLMFLMKRATEDEPTEYRTLTFKGAQTLLSPLGHEKAPEGKTIKDNVTKLIKDAIAYQAQEHEKRQEFLKSLFLEKEAADPPAEPDGVDAARVETAEEPDTDTPGGSAEGKSAKPTVNTIRTLAERIAKGDLAAFDELCQTAKELYRHIDYGKEEQRVLSNLVLMRAAFNVLGERAANGNPKSKAALKAYEGVTATPLPESAAEKPALLGMQISDDGQPVEQIGQVLGKPVYRGEIRTGGNVRLRSELHRLFTSPVMKKYREAHKDEIEPTEDEIRAATVFFDEDHRQRIKEEESQLRERLTTVQEQLARADLTEEEQRKLRIEKQVLQVKLKPPGRPFAIFVLHNWKFQRHLYDQYGGGRILWQQAGLEAFDACRTWLESREKQGDFTITDPTLRSTFYEYWTTMKHGAFLTDDKERIQSEFLEPEWLPKAPSQK